jgi:hypothetical protein
MPIVLFPIKSVTKTNLIFAVANTAVIFGSITSFSIFVTLSRQIVRSFGSIGDESHALGSFWVAILVKFEFLDIPLSSS